METVAPWKPWKNGMRVFPPFPQALGKLGKTTAPSFPQFPQPLLLGIKRREAEKTAEREKADQIPMDKTVLEA